VVFFLIEIVQREDDILGLIVSQNPDLAKRKKAPAVGAFGL
jgi:hypothetical protein